MAVEWKPKFLDRYSKLTDIDKFTEASLKPMRKSVRINTLKADIGKVRERLEKQMSVSPVPWCKEGFFVDGKGVGNTIEHFLGYIYIQGAASMIPPVVLNPKENELVLDICASPGSKTSQIAAMMNNTGLLIANDNAVRRMLPLSANLERCGVMNAVITQMEGYWFAKSGIKFDRILVDAPCSGIGTIRKSYKTIEIWNPGFSRKMASVQKQLLSTAFEILNPKGTIVYSTCTLEPEENEGVVSWLLEKYPEARLEEIKLDIKRSKPVEKFNGVSYSKEVRKCLRLWPQDNDTEGFFVAKIAKAE